MRLGAFLTHGLLSLVTNVVSDISLTTPQPPPPHLSIPPGMLVTSPGRSSTQDLTPLRKSGSPSPGLDSTGCVVLRWGLEQTCGDMAGVNQKPAFLSCLLLNFWMGCVHWNVVRSRGRTR